MLIAFIGPARSGKTTCANIMEDQGFARLSLASPLKRMLEAAGLAHSELYGNDKETPSPALLGKTPRHAMQSLGDWGRDEIDPDFWLEAWRKQYRFTSTLCPDVVVDDARFINELDCIRSLGGIIARVVRQDDRIVSHHHKSEIEWRQFSPDIYLANNGSYNDLKKTLAQTFGDRLAHCAEDYGR